jgi:hypothetical protein
VPLEEKWNQLVPPDHFSFCHPVSISPFSLNLNQYTSLDQGISPHSSFNSLFPLFSKSSQQCHLPSTNFHS